MLELSPLEPALLEGVPTWTSRLLSAKASSDPAADTLPDPPATPARNKSPVEVRCAVWAVLLAELPASDRPDD